MMFIKNGMLEAIKALMSCLVAMSCSTLVAHAGSSVTGPLRMEMSLASGQTLALGEPVVVHYAMNNLLPSEHLILNHGLSASDWYTVTLTDGSGHAVTVIPDRRAHSIGGLFQDKEMGVGHGGRAEGDIIVPTHRLLTRPGKYTLNLHATLSYVSEPDIPGDVDPATHFSLDRNYVLLFTVTAADSSQLRNTAEKLRQEAKASIHPESTSSTIKALFSMPEDPALTSWQALISDPDVPQRVLQESVNQLARLRSTAAVDLLSQLYWSPAQPPGVVRWAEVGQRIAEVYNTSDAPLKAHIRELFASHGIQLPNIMPEKSHPN